MNGLKWTVGDVEIYQIVELEAGEIIQEVIGNATPENIREISWLFPHFADEAGNIKALVQGFLIKSNDKSILIDTCNGNNKDRVDIPVWAKLQTDFLKRLRSVGIAESDVDVVACTHLHCDHIGWNTRFENGKWVPTFPNAEYLFAREEYDYWVQKPEKEIADDKAAFDDSITPIMEAGLGRLVEVNHQLDKNVRLIPSSGHTPCHVSVLIESQNQSAMISGDFLHHPCQIANPHWTTDADTLPEKGILTRQEIFDKIADSGLLLIGSHFANPAAGQVLRSKDGFIFQV